MERIDRKGGDGASPQDKARLIGEIVADAVLDLGERRAMFADGYVMIGPVGERGKPTGPTARGVRGVQK